MPPPIANVFVLMLENRSFDHMLGFSGISGTDAETGGPTTVNGLKGTESNLYLGQGYAVSQPAPDRMEVDPGHEFADVLTQLCGPHAAYPAGGAYPGIDNSGFVADYAASPSPREGNAPGNFGDIMKCCSPEQLPVLNTLAKAFAVCDNWFSSIPGPTWPNRFFACAASSGGLDHSPTSGEIARWEAFAGFAFPNGSIFDALDTKSSQYGWRIFAGDAFPGAGALKGITLSAISSFDAFPGAVADPNYPWLYTWIEPNYGDVANGTFLGGTSQHPLDGLSQGEAMIKQTYEAIRNSPHWESSLLIVTWDEHGGFYDHVAPPAATPPGDTQPGAQFNQYGFTFGQYGVRVPALVVSPLIPANLIDHRLYDHSSIPATVEAVFGLPPLTARDAAANALTTLLKLDNAREAPLALPDPPPAAAPLMAMRAAPPDAPIDKSLPGFLHVAMRHDMALSPPEAQPAILARVQAITTRAQAAQYLDEVGARVRARWAAG
ncbi:MAG TPA: alkaline phosphatase family protein [Stellaceae bacterium]|nr:alkaline phosphatase family protein [Stellaceae bacterium]